MIALTSRLNERDETIIQLQEELDAYDRINRETEQIIESQQMRILQLEQFVQEQCGEQALKSLGELSTIETNPNIYAAANNMALFLNEVNQSDASMQQ